MTSRADKLLEGFKLGSLGVSKKPRISLQEPTTQEPIVEPIASSSIKVLEEGFTDEKFGKECPFIWWEENDGKLQYQYAFVVSRADFQNHFELWFYGGDTMEYMPEGIYGNGLYYFKDYVFLKFSETRVPHDEVLRQFDAYRALVKTKGIAGFIAILPPFKKAKTDFRYNTWLKYMRKQLRIKK